MKVAMNLLLDVVRPVMHNIVQSMEGKQCFTRTSATIVGMLVIWVDIIEKLLVI